MGGVSSVPTDSSAALFLKDPTRFFIQSISVSVPDSPLHANSENASSSLESADAADRHIVGVPGSHLVLPNFTGVVKTVLNSGNLTFSTNSLHSKRHVEYIQVCPFLNLTKRHDF